MIPKDEMEWSRRMFGECELGDARRTERLVEVAALMSKQMGKSLAKSCQGDGAALLGSYRLLRNDDEKPEAIRAGGFAEVAQGAQAHALLLAVEDTTSVSYTHEVEGELGITSNQKDAKRKGFQVHSVLLVDAIGENTVGLIEQSHWCRERKDHGKKHTRKQRAYEDKESFKWQHASERTAERLGATMGRTISVCDRESDVYEYLDYKRRQEQRFVIRAKVDRRVVPGAQNLFAALSDDGARLSCYTVNVVQRGGRKARQATLTLRSLRLELQAPASDSGCRGPLTVNAILAEEVEAPPHVEPLRWVLLTSEAVASAEEARRVVRYYELRWRIEDYHKAWKSGVGVERQRFQSAANLERMLVITAFLAVRLLQLREILGRSDEDEQAGCDTLLSEDEWQVLWVSTRRSKPPATAPSIHWACLAVARLGGFTDTKRTGRPGWDTMWHGWFRLQERLEGYRMSKLAAAKL
jgi:Transposase DNA-binding/Transposase DDE domain